MLIARAHAEQRPKSCLRFEFWFMLRPFGRGGEDVPHGALLRQRAGHSRTKSGSATVKVAS